MTISPWTTFCLCVPFPSQVSKIISVYPFRALPVHSYKNICFRLFWCLFFFFNTRASLKMSFASFLIQ